MNEKEEIQKLEERLQRIKAEIEQRKNKVAQQEKKNETRKKILLGSAILNVVPDNDIFRELMKLGINLDECLTINRDRKLFGLPERNDVQAGKL